MNLNNKLWIRSDEGLTLETSAFRISVRWPIYIINSVDKTKFLYTTSPPTQHHSFFRNYPFIHNELSNSSLVEVGKTRFWNSLKLIDQFLLFQYSCNNLQKRRVFFDQSHTHLNEWNILNIFLATDSEKRKFRPPKDHSPISIISIIRP